MVEHQLMADSAPAMIGHSFLHALVVTADVILLAAHSVAADPCAAFVLATGTAGGAAYPVATVLRAATTQVAAAAFAFGATRFVAARS